MKILIVSGFLGAGKTTFIQSLASHTGKALAIFENEYGISGIDGDRLRNQQNAGTVNIWEMTESCICGSAKGDFAASVLTIANAADPEYLVVEPTGVAMLSKIIENLKQIRYERISLLSPVTIVDIHSWTRYLQEYPGLYKDQIREAGTIIVSKTENSGFAEKEEIRKMLEKINPAAHVIMEPSSSFSPSTWMKFLETNFDGTSEKLHLEIPQELPDSFSLQDVSGNSVEELILFLHGLIRGQYGNIIRAKGQIPIGTQNLQFDMTDRRYRLTGTDTVSSGKMVFFGSKILRREIRRHFCIKDSLHKWVISI